MKRRILIVILMLLLGFAASCQKQDSEAKAKPGEGIEADIAAIKALLAEWVRLYNAEDFKNLVSVFYTEDAVLMAPNGPARKTTEAILLGYQEGSVSYIEHVDTSVAKDVRVSGDLAFAWGTDAGTTTPRGGGDPVKYSVKWLMAFERQPDGAWKCLGEMWNDDAPSVPLP